MSPNKFSKAILFFGGGSIFLFRLKIKRLLTELFKSKNVFFTLTFVSFLLTLSITSGIFGYAFALKSIHAKIKGQKKGETMGRFIPRQSRLEISTAYKDQKKALKNMANYSWDIATIPVPFLGTMSKPGLHSSASINAYGFRPNHPIQIPKPSNLYRIIITGGSTAHGNGASGDESTIGGFLEKYLNQSIPVDMNIEFQVFTFASPTWTSTHERIAIENRLSHLEPDIVISISGCNDVYFGGTGYDVLWSRTFSERYYWSLLTDVYRKTGFGKLEDAVGKSEDWVKPEVAAKKLSWNVELSAYALNQKRIQYIYVLQPTVAGTKKPLSKHELWKRNKSGNKWMNYYKNCYNLFDRNLNKIHFPNFHYLNLSSIFDNQDSSDTIFIDYFHFGDKGNEIIANKIYEKILKII